MNFKDYGNRLSESSIIEKVLKIKEMYHPNLINHLSKEMYELYMIRESICNQILEVSNEIGIKNSKLKEFANKRIKEYKDQLSNTSDEEKRSFIRLNITEWEQFF